MRLVVTRPQADGERTAATLRAQGHDVLVAPLMRVEALPADLAGDWGAVVITSGNAPVALADNPARDALVKLPLYAVGRRSAEAARTAGFTDVTSAGGDVHDLVTLVAERHADANTPLLYLAGGDRAADLPAELARQGIAAEMRVVYCAVTAPYPQALIAALNEGTVDGVLHFSRRSAENYVAGAYAAGLTGPALKVRHYCLSSQVAAPLAEAGAAYFSVAAHPSETGLIELLTPSAG
ncbi:MAG: uroporphyrinogen-III synthase [Pseudolabrys sp.]